MESYEGFSWLNFYIRLEDLILWRFEEWWLEDRFRLHDLLCSACRFFMSISEQASIAFRKYWTCATFCSDFGKQRGPEFFLCLVGQVFCIIFFGWSGRSHPHSKVKQEEASGKMRHRNNWSHRSLRQADSSWERSTNMSFQEDVCLSFWGKRPIFRGVCCSTFRVCRFRGVFVRIPYLEDHPWLVVVP